MEKNTRLVNFPEKEYKDGVRICGEASYANQIAVLSQYLHNKSYTNDHLQDNWYKEKITAAIKVYLDSRG